MAAWKFLAEIIIGTLIFLPLTEKRPHFWQRMILWSAVALAICQANDMVLDTFFISGTQAVELFRYFIGFLAAVLVVQKCFVLTVWEALFFTSSGYALQNAAHYAFIIAYVMPMLQGWPHRGALVEILSILLVYGLAFILARPERKCVHLTVGVRSVVVVSLVTLLFTIVLSQSVPQGGKEYMLYYVYSLFSALLVLFLQYGVYEKCMLVHETDVIRQMLYMESRQHKISEESVELINLKCHDLKHQIHEICEKGGLDSDVTKEIGEAVARYDAEVKTGNPAVDVILTEKSLRCEQEKIEFSCMLDGHSFDFMESQDIYSLFGNILDNAIEGVLREKPEMRFISMKSGRQGELICLHADNYCTQNIRFEDGLPVTTKTSELGYHGYGVKSIRYLAEKYGGYAQMRQEDSRFILDVFLPQREN